MSRKVASTRPAFAAKYPPSPELDRLLAAFRAGNHAAVREGSSKLARGGENEAVRQAAEDLRRRVEPHPLSVYLLLLSVALLLILVMHYLVGAR
jgi:hypothetical protein